jgi:lipoprotein-releasing system permease protein
MIEKHLFSFQDYVTEGDLQQLENFNNGIFLGKGIADKMMLRVGDIIQVRASDGEPAILKVIGILQFGLADVDDTQSYTNLRTARQLLGVPASYHTDLQVKLHDISLAPSLAKEYAAQFRVDTIDIQTANAQFETGTGVRTIISYAVGITLLIVAGFGIYNILNMLIYEKMDSIAILKATGFSGRDVKYIFLGISTMIGISGGVAGLITGYGLSVLIDFTPFETQALPTITTFPVNYNPVYYIIGIAFSLITTYVAGVFPAKKAAQVDPVVIIRGK